MSVQPLGYLDSAGERAHIILPLTYLTLIISILVCIVIAILLWIGARRYAAAGADAETRATPLARGSNGLKWITVGLSISAVPLLITLVWTMVALAKVSGPPANTKLTLDITAHQWWWEVRYEADNPDQTFATANEIHIPVGERVLVRLHGGDVIHSFWVPKLSGKTDAIPGQMNVAWLQAQRPGRYRGQCAEYCGSQHAHMQLEVVAEPATDYSNWRAHQVQAAQAPTTPEQERGLAVVEFRCGLCHGVRGTTAGAVSAPDLTHLMSRGMLAAGTLPNSVSALGGWIEAPQRLKPGSLMPDQHLSAGQLADTVTYLETLK